MNNTRRITVLRSLLLDFFFDLRFFSNHHYLRYIHTAFPQSDLTPEKKEAALSLAFRRPTRACIHANEQSRQAVLPRMYAFYRYLVVFGKREKYKGPKSDKSVSRQSFFVFSCVLVLMAL